MFKIFKTEEFTNDFNKLGNSEKIKVRKIIKNLKQQGGNVGKPLAGLRFFKEKKFGGKRLFYLVYKEYFIILAIAIVNKKHNKLRLIEF